MVSSGISGGLPGAPNRATLKRATDVKAKFAAGIVPQSLDELKGEIEFVPPIVKTSQDADDVYASMSVGGGGYGDPLLRDPARVLSLIEGTLPPLAQRLGFREPIRVNAAGLPAHYRLERRPESEPGAPESEPHAFYLAVTEEWLLFSSSESTLQRTLARTPDSPSTFVRRWGVGM